MKKIKYNILEQIITEGRLEDVIKRYDGKLSEDVIRELSAGDPSGNNKYLDWMCAQRTEYTSQYIIDTVKCFHENVNRLSEKNVVAIFGDKLSDLPKIKTAPKDINSYPEPKYLDFICDYFEELKPISASRVKIYEDDRWLIVSPLTHEASCKYGAHSNWCVSTSNVTYYERYTKEGILVFFIDKKGKNPKKPNANIYKFAVNITFQNPEPIDWDWYSMEDRQTDSALMLNLLPKNLIEVTSKYLNEIKEEMMKKFGIDEKELQDKSLFYIGPTAGKDEYNVFLNLKGWSDGSIEEATSWLRRFGSDTDFVTLIKNYKQNGMTYITIKPKSPKPEIDYNRVTWSPITWANRTNNQVLKSDVIESIERGNSLTYGADKLYQIMTPEQKNLFLDSYFKLFNEAEVSLDENVATSKLIVGDTILYSPMKYGTKKPLKVTRVAEKSIQLSDGRRIARSVTNYKKRVIGVIKVVDSLNPTTETRWIRKRII